MHPACARFLAEAAGFVGKVHEDPPGSNRTVIGKAYGMDGQPYCDMGVSVCARRAGIPEDVIPNSAYVPARWDYARRHGWIVSSPEPGDLAVMNFDGGLVDHIGIVAAGVSPQQVLLIEFNTSPGSSGSQANGDGCWRRIRSRSLIEGFIRPPWHLIQEDDMPLTRADAALVASEVLSQLSSWQPPSTGEKPAPNWQTVTGRTYANTNALLGRIDALVTRQQQVVDVDALAAAIVAKLPAGAVDAQAIAAAVATELSTRLVR